MLRINRTKILIGLPLLLLIIAAAAAAIFFGSSLLKSRDQKFSEGITKCNAVTTNLRFSCYRSLIEKIYKGDVAAFSKKIKSDKSLSFEIKFTKNREVTYAVFGTNCHTFYHAAGDFVATYAQSGDVKTLLDMGPLNCTSGYVMGVYKRLALVNHFSEDLLKSFFTLCPKGSENQCAHEIGHNLHDKYSYSILKVIDDISKKEYGLTYPQKYDYVTIQNPDINAPFAGCRKIMPDDNKLAQCYTGIGHNLFLFSEFSPDGYKGQFAECEKTAAENRDSCYSFLIYRIGINHAATLLLSGKPKEANDLCNNIIAQANRPDLMKHCYLGIGGGLGLWMDSQYSAVKVDDNNLAQIKKELMDFAVLCNLSPEKYMGDCYSGLLGTKFKKFYKDYGMFNQNIEKLLPTLDSDFEVVG